MVILKKIKLVLVFNLIVFYLVSSCEDEARLELNLNNVTFICTEKKMNIEKILIAFVGMDTIFFAKKIKDSDEAYKLTSETHEVFVLRTYGLDEYKQRQVYIEGKFSKNGINYYVNEMLHVGEFIPDSTYYYQIHI